MCYAQDGVDIQDCSLVTWAEPGGEIPEGSLCGLCISRRAATDMYRRECSFKHNALNTLGRNCAFLPLVLLSWTHPASRLLHSEALFEYTPLLGVGMVSAPLKPQPPIPVFP